MQGKTEWVRFDIDTLGSAEIGGFGEARTVIQDLYGTADSSLRANTPWVSL